MSNSDYKKPRTNLNDFLPEVVKSKVIRTINENLFNRYLTKVEYKHVDGIIGLPDPNSASQIAERTPYDQKYQLQPVVYDKVGTIDWFMSFKDFLRKIERLGVDTEQFAEWGRSLQFNWVPPIDFDKLINFQDYYWDSAVFNDIPQYITVKNQCTWTESRFKQIKKSITNTTPTFKIFNVDTMHDIISVSGNHVMDFTVGEILVVTDTAGNCDLVSVASVVFNNASLKTDIAVFGTVSTFQSTISKTYLPIKDIQILSNKLIISGDVHLLFTNGYVFSTIGGPQPTRYWETLESVYDAATNTTTIIVSENVTNTFNWTSVSVLSAMVMAEAEANAVCSNESIDPLTTWTDSDVGKLVWVKNYNVTSGTEGSTIFATNIFTDSVETFATVQPNDQLIVFYDSGQTVQYPIVTAAPGILTLPPTVRLFTRTGLHYKIVRVVPFQSLISLTEPVNPALFQFWIDNVHDELKQWNGSDWIVKQEQFSLLYNTVNDRNEIDLTQTNDWSKQNKWIHRNEITTFTGKTRAQLPIIEYYPYLEFSSTSFASKQWKYKPTEFSSYVQVDAQPTLFELVDIKLTSTIEPNFSFQTESIILLNQSYGNLTADLVNGTKIVLKDFIDNDGVYEVASSEFIQMEPTARFITKIYLKEPVLNALDFPEGSSITPLITSLGDPFLGVLGQQWFFEGIKDITSSSINPIKNPMLNVTVNTGVEYATQWTSNTSYVTGQTVTNDGDKAYVCVTAGVSGSTGPTGTGANIQDNVARWNFINYNFSYILGLVWQELSVITSDDVNSLTINLDPSLHDLALYEDYQEGDIRVYIDGIRQYGNFTEFRSFEKPDYVGGITFNSGVVLNNNNVVRVELGEYALSDIGKRAVTILTASGYELYNLVDLRKIEQQKSESIQYPVFTVYDVVGNPLQFASMLFTFKEAEDAPIELSLLKRVVYDAATKNYTFLQHLIGPNKELYLYKDFTKVNNELQSIWQKGTNNEQYVPQRLPSGDWEIPNQWYYNISHDNREEITLAQLFRHFNTIIDAQITPSVFSAVGSSLFYLDDNINYGVGGTIKEHNNGLDLLVSSLFVNNVNPLTLIQFANEQYDNDLSVIQEKLKVDSGVLLGTSQVDSVPINNVSELTSYISEVIKDWFETNDKYDQWFGDSTTYNEQTDTGVKNWIATIPYFALSPKYNPYYINDDILNITQVYHHDGHRSTTQYNMAVKEQIYTQLKNNPTVVVGDQTVLLSSEPFPVIINGNTVKNGNYLLRNDRQKVTRKLYRYSSDGVWEYLNLDVLLAGVIVSFEQALFDNLPESTEVGNLTPIYNITDASSNSRYPELIREQFAIYVKDNNIETPFSSLTTFKSNNPFTWNYAYTQIPVNPSSGLPDSNVAAAWQALYTKVYGTPYPHLEPWILQEYVEKPLWWDDFYRDPSGARYWKLSMWTNIFNGIVPVSRLTPSGSFGSGLVGQITTVYSFVSVNVDNAPTIDGILPDGLLPPYWDTKNTVNPRVRSLYDPSLQQFIITPQANYLFGQEGPAEWEWEVSSQRLYDDLTISFKVDPMKFTYLTFGTEFTNANCLQVDKNNQKVFSHLDTVFHGDFIDDTNKVYLANGLNQWYVQFNRYNGYDDINSGFKSLWTDWQTHLSYIFGSFIDTPSFFISSDIFDIVTKDFNILTKKTVGVDDKWIDALKGTILNVPSQYVKDRDNSIAWTAQFDNTSPVGRNITYYAPEDYNFRVKSSDTFRTYSYDIAAAGVEDIFGYQIVSYNQSIVGILPTQMQNGTFEYWFSIKFDGGAAEVFSIRGQDMQTFNELVSSLNTALVGKGSAYIENGDIVIRSNTFGATSSIDITDMGLFVSANTSLFNNISISLKSSLQFLNYFIVKGNMTEIFNAGEKAVISGSENYDGTYNVIGVTYDIVKEQTTILVEENITIISMVVDGIIEPINAKTLPDTWQTGTQIYLTTTGILPSGLDNIIPYYVIRIIGTDREFKLADTYEKSLAGVGIITSSLGIGEQFAGRVQSTFKALNGKTTSVNWRRHFSDKRYLNSIAGPIVISGIQYMIDFIKGYEDYTTDIGFLSDNTEGENIDIDTGRINTWLLQTEKFIDELYTIRTVRVAQQQQYEIQPVSSGNFFQLKNNYTVNWQVGTQVVLSHGDNGQLPEQFNNPLMGFVPYYVIPSFQRNKFQLALSLSDAKVGKAIVFTDNGFGDIFATVYKSSNNFPVVELNPFKNYIWVRNDLGVMADIFDSSSTDILTNQRIYDNNGNEMTVKELIPLREDKQSRISLTLLQQEMNTKFINSRKYMQGMHLFFDGYENILMFNDYSTEDILIYDPFLGINTPRFYLNYNRQNDFTLRPNVGGFVLSGGNLIQNFEAATDNLRDLYNVYNVSQEDTTTDIMRKSFGYEGSKDYMDALKINDKSQFVFWQGMIQSKGTRRAVNAFINQKTFGDLIIDEFWAYKLATFGDTKERNYVEMKLRAEDVTNKELRLEFVLPDSTAIDDTFKPIKLTDLSRWWDQPDQYLKMSPIPSFYFNTKIIATVENAETKIQIINGQNVLQLPTIAGGVIVTYYDAQTFTRKPLQEHIDYTYLNSSVLIFTNSIFTVHDVTVYVATYDYDAQNPALIIDKKAETIVANIPIWNPVLGQYYYNAIGIVNLKTSIDPAKYSNDLNTSNNSSAFWNNKEIKTVWFDDSIEGYLPYYDPQIYPNVNDQLSNWGILAEWADVKLYEWTESDIPPTEWNDTVNQQANDLTIPQAEKKTGQVRTLLYKYNSTSGTWAEEKAQHFEVTADLISIYPITLTFNPTVNIVKIYINGTYKEDISLGNQASAANNLINYISALDPKAYVHVVIPAHVPTQQELDNGDYSFYTPYSSVTLINKDTTQPYQLYYFWVTNKTNKEPFKNDITIFEAEKLLKNMTAPYQMITGFRGTDFGYGLIYGHVFDETAYDVPFRFVQSIVRGLSGLVNDNDRYALRFTRDFTLRDKLPTGEMLNDVHVEWKLFREKQLSKIDIYLWDKLISALVGLTIINRELQTVEIPSLDRILYDDLYQADTKYGLGEGQIFTDSKMSLATILGILTNPNLDIGNIDIEQFLSKYNFISASDIASAMYEIYDTFPIETINYIYFQTLLDAFTLKKKFPEIFKTSWVAIQIAQNVSTGTNAPLNTYTLETGGQCYLGLDTDVDFNFIPLMEYVLYVTIDGSISYTSFNGITLNTIHQELPNRIAGIGTITGVWSDGTYVYISSINGGIDAYFYNGTNFVILDGIPTNGTGLGVTGYNPVLTTSDDGDGLGVYLFNGVSFKKVGTSAEFDVSNVRDVIIHNNYIITCGEGRLDAWFYDGTALIHVNELTVIVGGNDITKIVSDGTYIYSGSNNTAKIQIFTFDGATFNQVYTDNVLTSGPSVAVGNGYLFMNGSDLLAYEFDGINLASIDTAEVGPTNSIITFSEETQRLYVADVGIFNFLNNKFERLYNKSIVNNAGTDAYVLGDAVLKLPPPSPTPTPSVTTTPTPTLTKTMTTTPTVTPTVTLTSTPAVTPTITTTLTPTLSSTPTSTSAITPTSSSMGTPTNTPPVTPTPTMTIAVSNI